MQYNIKITQTNYKHNNTKPQNPKTPKPQRFPPNILFVESKFKCGAERWASPRQESIVAAIVNSSTNCDSSTSFSNTCQRSRSPATARCGSSNRQDRHFSPRKYLLFYLSGRLCSSPVALEQANFFASWQERSSSERTYAAA